MKECDVSSCEWSTDDFRSMTDSQDKTRPAPNSRMWHKTHFASLASSLSFFSMLLRTRDRALTTSSENCSR